MNARDGAMKVGLMVPMNNTTMERELLAWLPPHSTCRTLKIPRGKGLLTRDTVPAYKAAALSLGESFAGMELDAVVYGCTAAGFIMGPEGDARLADDLARITERPVVTTAHAMVQALEDSGAKRIAVVTPYPEEINRQLTAFLSACGIGVTRLNTLGAANTEELGRIQAPAVADLARRTMGDDCDALFIACSQLPTHEILAGLQDEYGRPVWSSIYATAWQAKRALGVPA
jgi:maleate cis-trans isomerase